MNYSIVAIMSAIVFLIHCTITLKLFEVLYSWIFFLTACDLIGFFEVTWHLTMKLFPTNSAVLGLSGEMGTSKSKG